ncbi:MAG: hypothetical protein IJQ16_00900, partial [Selenomonadaceae bacterium]|nr:hypothetical protein [Selenomonadaceae bacterium]
LQWAGFFLFYFLLRQNFWMTVFQLTFLLPYVIAIRAEKADPSKLKNFLMPILGFFAGCSNEAGGLATIFLAAIFIFVAARKNFLKSWMLFGFATLILGALICILAPGNFAQTEYIRSVNPAFNFSAELLKNNFLEGFLPVLYLDLAAILPTIIYFFKRGSINLNTADIIILSFASAGLIVPLSMIFSPKFDSARVAMLSLPFMIISAVAAYGKLKNFSFRQFLARDFLLFFVFMQLRLFIPINC